jgi:PPM family protein phosphatase
MTSKKPLVMRVDFGTDTGRVRSRNEDAVFADGQRGLFIVADGMGGHQAGEVASRIAIETISGRLHTVVQGGSAESTRQRLVEVVGDAHEEILRRSSILNELEGMGSTIVLAWVVDEWVHVANVGDSRAYLFRSEGLRQLTDDHSIAARMVRQGALDAKDARQHAMHSVLYNALGHDSQPSDVDVHSYEHHEGDTLLLCSDGLTDMVEDHEIEKALRASASVQEVCDKLIGLANQNGGKDNITAIVVRFGGA